MAVKELGFLTMDARGDTRWQRPIVLWAIFFVVLASWCLALDLPPFDFDESYYRRVAEEILASGNWIVPTYNFKETAYKPPTYPWFIAATSLAFAEGGQISGLAARLPSLLATLGMTLMVGATLRRGVVGLLLAALVWGAALFPSLGGSAVLIDPVFSFFLTPVLVILSGLSNAEGNNAFHKPTSKQSLIIGVCLAVACALKGPFGIVFPAVSIFVFAVVKPYARNGKSLREALRSGVQSAALFGPPFVFAVVMSAFFYMFLYYSGGDVLVRRFFLVENLERATRKLEGHGGPFFYHFLVILVGGVPLVPMAFLALRNAVFARTLRPNFAFVWVAVCVMFFSLAATKLPNYTWPIWPAVVLAVCLKMSEPKQLEITAAHTPSRWQLIAGRSLEVLAYLPSSILAVAFVTLPLSFGALQFLPMDARAKMAFDAIGNLPFAVTIGFLLAGLSFALVTFVIKKSAARPFEIVTIAQAALCSSVVVVILKLTVVPFASQVMTESYAGLAREAHALGASKLALIGYASPNVSSAFQGAVAEYGRGDSTPFREGERVFVITPIWNASTCGENGFVELRRSYFAVLCASSPK